MKAKNPTLAGRLERFKNGEVFDWENTEISGVDLSDAIRTAFQSNTRIGILTLQNARVKGNVLLDTVGCDGALPSFQAIDCRFSGGLRSGHADWRQLSILKSEIAFIQLPYTRFSRDLSICETKCSGPCLLAGIEVAQANSIQCTAVSDPSLYAADLMLPIVDLGQENLCKIPPTSTGGTNTGISLPGGNYRLFASEAVAAFGLALYKMLGWALVSLAIATWSGLFRRAGRE